MITKKIIPGRVIQLFGKLGNCLGQEFIADGDVGYVNAETDEPIQGLNFQNPTDMMQPGDVLVNVSFSRK